MSFINLGQKRDFEKACWQEHTRKTVLDFDPSNAYEERFLLRDAALNKAGLVK